MIATRLASALRPTAVQRARCGVRTALFNDCHARLSSNTSVPVSSRGPTSLGLLPQYLVDTGNVEFYDKDSAPSGCLQVSIAENRCVAPELVSKINSVQKGSAFTPDMIYYQSTSGMESCRLAMSSFMSEIMSASEPLNPENLVVGAGCNAMLENLFLTLCEAGDCVLLPSPYYATFSFDLGSRAGVTLLQTGKEWTSEELARLTAPETYYPSLSDLSAAYDSAPMKPKALLLTNPHNPLGLCYPRDVLDSLLSWATERNMHVVSDEIYAGSVHGSGFNSLADDASSRDNVHVVYALSKDLCLSGLRVGALYSSNEEVLAPVRKLNDLCQVSSTTQQLVAGMLGDERWVSEFTATNLGRIRKRYERVIKVCEGAGVPYLPADAGLYIWLDLRGWLGEEEEGEKVLYRRLISDYGLMMTPGESMDMRAPGFFRLVFTAVGDEEFELVLERLARLRK
mmetsp:Transcript_26043/g.51958  ORF Transcript_26043/g.51958 Transcript_26043/m.51958 type:complete len:455 (-) Transcript_26043:1386-2750(-)